MLKQTQDSLTKQDLLKYVKFMDDAKKYVGLSEYEIRLATDLRGRRGKYENKMRSIQQSGWLFKANKHVERWKARRV